mmetsp:Transcript_23687/g.29553  ORF Transcript_23687/g.29553 Transcript_23687/m.29553 type:complete len:256 (-) Transcript_23687:4852-5619(-)
MVVLKKVVSVFLLSASLGLGLVPSVKQVKGKMPYGKEIGGYIIGLVCATQTICPTVPVYALDLDYNDLYKSSATANEPSFKFNMPPPAPKKAKVESTPSESQSFKVPEVPEVSKFETPDLPKVEMPKIDIPKINVPKMEMPKIDLPDVPKFETPDMPKIDIPAPKFDISAFGGSAEKKSKTTDFVDRDVLDSRARDAKQDFKAADGVAKDAEAQARALRKIANEKKQIFKDAKDAACESRPGGKFLCIRGFAAGF